MIANDKIIHFLAGFGAAAIMLPFVGLWAVAAAVAIGAAKEWHDWLGYGTPDWNDFYATVGGGIVAAAANYFLAYLIGAA